jgi:general stress protein YciG
MRVKHGTPEYREKMRENARKGALVNHHIFREGDERAVEAGRKGGLNGRGDSKRRYGRGA